MAVDSKIADSTSNSTTNSTSLWKELSIACIDDPFFLNFQDISYNRRESALARERKTILRNISGDFRPGELTAIMGASGAGKTTLMDILAGFITSSFDGSVIVNGTERNLVKFRRSSTYIMQDDNMQPFFTVEEAMLVAADLKLTLKPRERLRRIEEILSVMGLKETRYTRIGALSGGQKKRLAISLELINNPPIIFLDEPTSGLDSVTSKQCIRFLKQLALEGRTIICTIHQPSASLFNMIDHLYIIAGGYCVYTGGTHNLVPYLSSLGLHCPTHYNPADFIIEICNGDYGNHLSKLVETVQNGKSNAWRSSVNLSLNKAEEIIVTHMSASSKVLQQTNIRVPSFEVEYKHTTYYATGFWKQFHILLRRNAIKLLRDKILILTRISMHLFIALIVGAIFFRIGQDATYVLDNFNLLFFNLMFLMFSAFSSTLITLPLELPILMREHFNRWYKLRSFYLANKFADFPVQLTATCIYTLIVYFMSNQILETKRLILYVLMCFVVTLVAQAIGFIIGAGLTVQNGVIFGPLIILPFTIFSGFFVHLTDAHPYLHWLFHISFLKYGFEGTMMTIYGYDRPKMHCSDVYCHFAMPNQLMMAVGMKQVDYWFCMIVLIILYIVLDTVAYIILRIRLRKRI
ncbi:ATP-binding cassette sub-family G member 1-like isoform X1 [Vespa mandarinia]|uniref:ATP-binding cassette sub-family G member 1-like isoform X1 n=2 Tax=Vespa mandarinia TaxID=7446 RepID=UPI00160A0604|nr:ATP-binding cassette sub-family G member 1-like isoform X1 [Vespa mandarinia]